MAQVTLARGIRNNNPLNIRKGQKWQGLAEKQTDPSFCQFVSMSYGCRAAAKILKKYMMPRCSGGYGLTSVASIVSRWAPRCENDTEAYIKTVCSLSGLSPFEHVDFKERAKVVAIMEAMARVECGQPVDAGYFEAGYDMVD